MATDLTVGLFNRPGTLLSASEALGRAGINIDGACGFVCEGQGVFHILVQDGEAARRTLIDAGFEILAERRVLLTPVENRPGGAAAVLRGVAEAGLNVDLLYLAADARLVVGGPDIAGLKRVLERP